MGLRLSRGSRKKHLPARWQCRKSSYQAKHAEAKTEATTWQTAMPATGDASELLGETFVIGGTVLVAAGVFLSDKRRQLIR